jgi:hypothetical protein
MQEEVQKILDNCLAWREEFDPLHQKQLMHYHLDVRDYIIILQAILELQKARETDNE